MGIVGRDCPNHTGQNAHRAHNRVRRVGVFAVHGRNLMEQAKSILLSKTLWFNVIALIVLVAGSFGFTQAEIDPNLETYALVIVTVVNILLRLVTKQPVKIA